MAKSKKKSKKKEDVLNQVDVVFVIDTTGSMSPYIEEARKHAVSVIKNMEAEKGLDIQVAVVAYRDHPPQDNTYVTKTFDFTEVENLQEVLNGLEAAGGGDHPEAVWDGINAVFGLKWRDKSDRVIYLIGDAPPHGFNIFGDTWAEGCPCGLTKEKLLSSVEELKIEVNAHSIANQRETTAAFELFTKASNGVLSVGDRAQDTTIMYDLSLTSHSDSISSARSLIATATAGGGVYTVNSAMAAGESLGFTKEKTEKAIRYVAKRGLDE